MTGTKNFSLHKRTKKNKTVFYCQFKNPDGSWSTAKSTGINVNSKNEKQAYKQAITWAINYLHKGNGIIIKSENLTLAEFAQNFFSWDGEYAVDKRAIGKRISERQCLANQRQTDSLIIPSLGKLKLSQIDRTVLKFFRNDLYKKGYSGSTINKALCNIHTILDAAYERSLIQHVPKVEKVANNPKRKGILTIEETKRLFSREWSDYRAYVMNMTAAASGLRRGELLALQIKNYKGDYIEVEKSYDTIMKRLNSTTKNGRTRRVIIPSMAKSNIETLIDINPYNKDPEAFIFFSETPDKPIHGEYVNNCLYRELKQIGISEQERKERGLCFHGWRTAFNSWLINAHIPLAKVMNLTGHLSREMAEDTYFRLDDMSDVLQITEAIFTIPN